MFSKKYFAKQDYHQWSDIGSQRDFYYQLALDRPDVNAPFAQDKTGADEDSGKPLYVAKNCFYVLQLFAEKNYDEHHHTRPDNSVGDDYPRADAIQ